MPRQHRTRYDTFEVPSGPELKAMYIKEGMSEAEAEKKAKELHDFLNLSADREAEFWHRVREHEETVGLNVESYLEGEEGYAS